MAVSNLDVEVIAHRPRFLLDSFAVWVVRLFKHQLPAPVVPPFLFHLLFNCFDQIGTTLKWDGIRLKCANHSVAFDDALFLEDENVVIDLKKRCYREFLVREQRSTILVVNLLATEIDKKEVLGIAESLENVFGD